MCVKIWIDRLGYVFSERQLVLGVSTRLIREETKTVGRAHASSGSCED